MGSAQKIIDETPEEITQEVIVHYSWDLPLEKSILRGLLKQMICTEYSITMEEMLGPSTTQQCGDARKVYAYLSRKYFKDTFHRIGFELNRDHSSIVHAINKVEDFISINDMIVPRMNRIEHEFFKHKLHIK